jgi:Ca2+-binding RTX toxin-like protein
LAAVLVDGQQRNRGDLMTRTSRPRHMARRSLLVGSVILAGAAATAFGVNGGSAQAAPNTCTVNAVPVPGPIINGTAGADTIDCAEATGTRTINGLAGNDTITGSPYDDTINGGTGDDTMTGVVGNDLLNGDDGDDTGTGSAGNDTLNGGNGADTLHGSEGLDILNGNADADTLNGNTGNDNLDGGTGVDIISGNEDNDSLTGPPTDGVQDTVNGGAGTDNCAQGLLALADNLTECNP